MTYPEVAVHQGCCLETLRRLESESVHCVVTSPPYYSLRDYGTGRWEGGSAECDHVELACGMSEKNTLGHGESCPNRYTLPATNAANVGRQRQYRDTCGKCGARRVDQQIGLEASVGDHIAKLVEVFREVRRVLRRDGTLWLNYGDAYAGSGKGPTGCNGFGDAETRQGFHTPEVRMSDGFKPKDLLLLPHRLAIALQNDGWWVRSDIVWSKLNPMPESVQDRPTRSHEYVFLLSRSERYYYDADAVREASQDRCGNVWKEERKGNWRPIPGTGRLADTGAKAYGCPPAGRNKRTVWEIATESYAAAHFATFPRALVRPCILAGTSAEGCCHACGAPFCRVVERESVPTREPKTKKYESDGHFRQDEGRATRCMPVVREHGWAQSCDCWPCDKVPAVVLDPFMGSGTTLEVALSLGRSAIGLELNAEYCELAKRRISRAQVPLALEY